MASLASTLYFFVISFLLLFTTNAIPIDHQIVLTTDGEVQLTVTSEFLLVPNLQSPFGPLSMRLNFNGSGSILQVNATTSTTKSNSWTINLQDDSTVFVSTKKKTGGVKEYYFVWSCASGREVCFDLGNGSLWYNTYQSYGQRWPLDTATPLPAYPVNSIQADATSSPQLIIEHLFFSSTGYALHLDRLSPAWLRLIPANSTHYHNPQLCIKSEARPPYSQSTSDPKYTYIKFSLHVGKNIRQVYDSLAGRYEEGIIPKPKSLPNEPMCTYPSWFITPGRSHYFASNIDLNKAKIIEFSANLSHKYGYRRGLLLLDIWWTNEEDPNGRSSLTFDQKHIDDPEHVTKQLHAAEHTLGLVILPYISTKSSTFKYNPTLLVRNTLGGTWQENGKALLDITSIAGRGFFLERLKKLQQQGVDAFDLLPIRVATAKNLLQLNDTEMQKIPMLFAEAYLQLSQKLGPSTILEEGHETQDLAAFVRITPRDSDWNSPNGIRSVIPTVLALSVAGYSFIIPDIIGGRNGKLSKPPTEELYIRWTQLATYLPVMQFATPPWEYSPKTAQIIKALVDEHIRHSVTFLNLARQRLVDGVPVLRPLWYNWPDDAEVYAIDDQFMVGENLLVAPVLEKGATKRRVYLPMGNWREVNSDHWFMGPLSLTIDAPLHVLPRFIRDL